MFGSCVCLQMTITEMSVKSRIRLNLHTLEHFTSVLWRSWALTVRWRLTVRIQTMTLTCTLPHHLRKSTSSKCCPPASLRRIITVACASASESSHKKLLVRSVGKIPKLSSLSLSFGISIAFSTDDRRRFLNAFPHSVWSSGLLSLCCLSDLELSVCTWLFHFQTVFCLLPDFLIWSNLIFWLIDWD